MGYYFYLTNKVNAAELYKSRTTLDLQNILKSFDAGILE